MKAFITYLLSISLLTNTMSWAFYVSLINMALTPKVMAADEIYEGLENTYNISDPNSNRNAEVSNKVILQKYANTRESGANYNQTITEKYTGKSDSSALDLTKYQGQTYTNESVINSAKSDGASIGGKVSVPSMTNGQLNTSYTKEGAMDLKRGTDGSISITKKQTTTPGTKPSTTEIYSSEQKHSDTKFYAKDSYGNEDAFTNEIKQRKSDMYDGGSYDAIAYRTLVNATKDNPKTSLSPSDPMFNAGRNEIANANSGVGSWMQSCSDTTTTKTVVTHHTDMQDYYCNAPKVDNYDSCTISRELTVPVYIDGGFGTLEMCGENCVKIRIGHSGDDYWGSSNESKNNYYTNALTLKFHKDAQISSAIITLAEWDDHMRVSMDGKQVFAHIDGAVREEDYAAPIATKWEQGKSWTLKNIGGPMDITDRIKNVVQSSTTHSVEMQQQVWVGGKGEGHFEITFHFANMSLADNHIQEPAGCYDAVQQANSFCRFDRFADMDIGTKRLPADILAYGKPLYPGDNGNLTWKTNLEGYFCDPLAKEKLCQYDANGNVMKNADGSDMCYSYSEIKQLPDQCAQYKTDTSCTLVKETCADGWFDDGTQQCYLKEQHWQCDRGQDITHTTTETTNACIGMIPCSGGTCQTGAIEENGDFGKAASYSAMVQYMQGESTCTDPNDPNTCSVFSGAPEWCGRSVGFVNSMAKTDCCEAPQGTAGALEAISLAGQMMRNTNWESVNAKLVTWTGGESGAWSSMTNSVGQWTAEAGKTVGQMWGRVTQSITSVYESVAGNITRTVGSSTATSGAGVTTQLTEKGMSTFGLAAIKQQLMNKAYDMMPNAVRDFVFQKSAEAGGQVVFSAAIQNFMLALNVIGWIYTAYQITKMLLEMLVACDQKEMEASIHKNQKSCFVIDTERCVKYLNVGFTKKCVKKATDMCCYNSMMSRIIMEQAYPQLGIDPVAAQCAGLTVGQLQSLDFDKINLDEWIESATLVGETPDPYANYSEQAVADLSDYKGEYTQLSSERTEEQMGGEDNMIKAREENTQAITLDNVDCSYLPRPAVCEIGGPYTDGSGKKLDKYK